MAKTSNLREFQEGILLKLKEATSQGAATSTSRLGVMVSGKRLLINLHEVSEVLPVPTLQKVPLTHPWFLGVANVRGVLYNISDLGLFMGMMASPKTIHSRILLLNSQTTTQAALVITSLVGLRSLDTLQAISASKNNGSEMRFYRQGYVDADNQEWFELDVEALLQNLEFNQPNI